MKFLIIKKLNKKKQIKQVEMLVKYYFKIKYIKGTDNIKVNIFSRKVKL